MCGIAGIFVANTSQWRPSKDDLLSLLDGIKDRGFDATGYGTHLDDGRFYSYKGNLSVAEYAPFFKAKNDLPISHISLLHTRAANIGDPANNNNNHPIDCTDPETGRRVLVVHNGTLGNLKKAYTELGVEQIHEVDSALIPTAMAKLGLVAGLKFLVAESCGNATLAAYGNDGHLLLARDNRPLYLAFPQPGVLLWSSVKDGLKAIAGTVELGFGFHVPPIIEMDDQKYIVFAPDGAQVESGHFMLRTLYNAPTMLKGKGEWTTGQTFTTGSAAGTRAGSGTPYSVGKHVGFHKPGQQTCTICKVTYDVWHDCTKLVTIGQDQKTDSDTPAWVKDTQDLVVQQIAERRDGFKVICHWAGCFTKEGVKIVKIRRKEKNQFVALCTKHHNKLTKMSLNDLVLSSGGEMQRKLDKIS